MKTRHYSLLATRYPLLLLAFFILHSSFFISHAAAQSAAQATVTGRVFSIATGLYLKNAEVRVNGEIDEDVAAQALSFFEVDSLGLDMMDNKILTLLTSTFRGRPVGLTTLSNALGEDADTVEDVYEPYLLQQGLLQRTPKGRVATERAFEHCGIPYTGDAGDAGSAGSAGTPGQLKLDEM